MEEEITKNLRNAMDNLLSDIESVSELSEENQKPQKFTKTNVIEISKDLFAEFRKLAEEKYGIGIKIGAIKFSETMFKCSFEFEILQENGFKKLSSKELFLLNLKALNDGLIKENESIYGKKYINNNGQIFAVVGYSERKKKQPYILMVSKTQGGNCNAAYLKNKCQSLDEIESI